MCPFRPRETPLAPVLTALLAAATLALAPGVALRAASQAPAAAAPEPLVSRVDGDRLIADLHALASPEMEGRHTGSPGGLRARTFIRDRFQQLGLESVRGSYLQPFRVSSSRSPSETSAANVLGTITGRREPDRFVLVSAHYDHLGVRPSPPGARGARVPGVAARDGGHAEDADDPVVYPGADDNASGVAALLAIAQWFARHPPDRSILFIAFDAEELGLAGSKRFVSDPPVDLRQVLLLVNMDMVGRGDDGTLVVAGTRYSPAFEPVVRAAAYGRDLQIHFGHDRPASAETPERDWTHASDHGPFHAAGVPFLYFGVRDHGDYHRPTDTPDRIPRHFFVEATELMLDVVRRVATP